MNNSQISAKWLQFSGIIKQKWGKLINDEETQAMGSIDVLTGNVKAEYSKTKEAAFHQLNDLLAVKTDENKIPSSKKE